MKGIRIRFGGSMLDADFVEKYKDLVKTYGEGLAKLNGLHESQLDNTEFIDNFVDQETVADASIDGNANVGHKDMVTLMQEKNKSENKLLVFNKLYYEMKKAYGKEIADQWFEAEWDGHLYMHDAHSASLLPYCFAHDLRYLAEKGLFFLDNFNAEPPKHLTTFVDFLKEFISFVENRSSGACGLPNLIPYMYYFWSRDVKDGYYTKSPEVYAKQAIQRFIYAVNQPYTRDGIQSA